MRKKARGLTIGQAAEERSLAFVMITRGCSLLLLLKMVISDNVERMSLSGREIMQAVELSDVCKLAGRSYI